MGQPDVEKVIHAYIALRDRKNDMKKKHMEELRPINQKMEVMEGWLLRDLQTRSVESQKTASGTAYVTTVSSATVKDRDALFDFVRENEMWDLLENRVSKSVVRDYLEETNEVIPGVNYQEAKAVRIRR